MNSGRALSECVGQSVSTNVVSSEVYIDVGLGKLKVSIRYLLARRLISLRCIGGK